MYVMLEINAFFLRYCASVGFVLTLSSYPLKVTLNEWSVGEGGDSSCLL